MALSYKVLTESRPAVNAASPPNVAIGPSPVFPTPRLTLWPHHEQAFPWWRPRAAMNPWMASMFRRFSNAQAGATSSSG